MKTIITSFVLLCLIPLSLFSQSFPKEDWEYITDFSETPFSEKKLIKLKQFISDNLETKTLLVIHKGKIVCEYGNSDKKYGIRSIRKSLMSSLYGRYIEQGYIDTSKTMKELNIVDFVQLNEIEQTASIKNCLMAKSGIYLPAETESASMLANKPKRGSYKPDEFWCYNNWDFNVLATILQRETGKDFLTLIKFGIADKIGMGDYETWDGTWYCFRKSIHPSHQINMSGKSLARFGYLMLRKGKWNNEQIIPEHWIETVTASISDATSNGTDGYGYMWWVAKERTKHPHFYGCDVPKGTYSARGAGGQYLIIIPEYDIVVVHQTNADKKDQVSAHAMGYILNKIFEAGLFPNISYPELKQDNLNYIIGKYEIRKDIIMEVFLENGNLYIKTPKRNKELLIPLDTKTFLTTRNAITLKLIEDKSGKKNVHLQQMNFDRVIKKI